MERTNWIGFLWTDAPVDAQPGFFEGKVEQYQGEYQVIDKKASRFVIKESVEVFLATDAADAQRVFRGLMVQAGRHVHRIKTA